MGMTRRDFMSGAASLAAAGAFGSPGETKLDAAKREAMVQGGPVRNDGTLGFYSLIGGEWNVGTDGLGRIPAASVEILRQA